MALRQRGVFLDLNGTLILPLKPETLDECREIQGAAEAVALLSRAGFVCPVVTVQSRIDKGLFSETEFRAWFRSLAQRFAEHGGSLEGPYVCPHRYADPCGCKKAGGELYRRAARDLGIDLASSFVIGDGAEDMEAAQRLGCERVLVRTGWPVQQDVELLASYVANDVLAASRWIVAAHPGAK